MLIIPKIKQEKWITLEQGFFTWALQIFCTGSFDVGLSCVLQGVQLHPWFLPTRCQQHPFPTPSYDNQKCFPILSNAPWRVKQPLSITEIQDQKTKSQYESLEPTKQINMCSTVRQPEFEPVLDHLLTYKVHDHGQASLYTSVSTCAEWR